jgi:hypothetical protein
MNMIPSLRTLILASSFLLALGEPTTQRRAEVLGLKIGSAKRYAKTRPELDLSIQRRS